MMQLSTSVEARRIKKHVHWCIYCGLGYTKIIEQVFNQEPTVSGDNHHKWSEVLSNFLRSWSLPDVLWLCVCVHF